MRFLYGYDHMYSCKNGNIILYLLYLLVVICYRQILLLQYGSFGIIKKIIYLACSFALGLH